MMKNPESKRPVTVEDLLRFKRAERPPAEFWTRFEQELRAKQLAAIVAKKPWWRAAPTFLTSWTRYHLPVGAAAVLAVTFVSVRSFQGTSSQPQVETIAMDSSREFAADVASLPAAAMVPAAPQNVAAEAPVIAPVAAEMLAAAEPAENEPALVSSALVPAVAEPVELKVPSPTAESIAANLAVLKETHPELVGRYLGASVGFEKRGMPERKQVVDPLTQMKGPADLHRERLLSGGLPVAAMATMRTGERIARRISSDRLTEELGSRFGARADSFTFKF